MGFELEDDERLEELERELKKLIEKVESEQDVRKKKKGSEKV